MAADVDAHFPEPPRPPAELTPVRHRQGSIRCPYGSNLPTDLLGRMIRFRINEYEPGGVKWM